MRKQIGFLITLGMGIAVFVLTEAGDTEPPGPPAPTMVTLQQIYDKLGDCAVGGRCLIPKTGQTQCWDEFGESIDCAGTGQDGEYQAGVSIDPRFTDNGDGTVTDNLTRLVWLQDADCFGLTNWNAALSAANALADGSCGLADGSLPGDWRLPNVRELVSVVDFDQWKVGPSASDLFTPMENFPGYWSSTNSKRFPDHSWVFVPGGGQLNLRMKAEAYYVWAVRGGM